MIDRHNARAADVDLETAIRYVEDPGLVAQDYPAEKDQASVWRRMDGLLRKAEREQPLAWQAYRARVARRPAMSTIEGAKRIAAMTASGELSLRVEAREEAAASGKRGAPRRRPLAAARVKNEHLRPA
jgi:hypothetical protein